jgi:hypothetical protein
VTAAESEPVSQAAERAAGEAAGIAVQASAESAATVKHGVTTRKITLFAVICQPLGGQDLRFDAGADTVRAWVPAEDIGTQYPLSSPQHKLLQKILAPKKQLSLF